KNGWPPWRAKGKRPVPHRADPPRPITRTRNFAHILIKQAPCPHNWRRTSATEAATLTADTGHPVPAHGGISGLPGAGIGDLTCRNNNENLPDIVTALGPDRGPADRLRARPGAAAPRATA